MSRHGAGSKWHTPPGPPGACKHDGTSQTINMKWCRAPDAAGLAGRRLHGGAAATARRRPPPAAGWQVGRGFWVHWNMQHSFFSSSATCMRAGCAVVAPTGRWRTNGSILRVRCDTWAARPPREASCSPHGSSINVADFATSDQRDFDAVAAVAAPGNACKHRTMVHASPWCQPVTTLHRRPTN